MVIWRKKGVADDYFVDWLSWASGFVRWLEKTWEALQQFAGTEVSAAKKKCEQIQPPVSSNMKQACLFPIRSPLKMLPWIRIQLLVSWTVLKKMIVWEEEEPGPWLWKDDLMTSPLVQKEALLWSALARRGGGRRWAEGRDGERERERGGSLIRIQLAFLSSVFKPSITLSTPLSSLTLLCHSHTRIHRLAEPALAVKGLHVSMAGFVCWECFSAAPLAIRYWNVLINYQKKYMFKLLDTLLNICHVEYKSKLKRKQEVEDGLWPTKRAIWFSHMSFTCWSE